MTIPDAAIILTRFSGREVSQAMLRAHVKAGAPVNSDGTLNLIHYAAWLVREVGDVGD